MFKCTPGFLVELDFFKESTTKIKIPSHGVHSIFFNRKASHQQNVMNHCSILLQIKLIHSYDVFTFY